MSEAVHDLGALRALREVGRQGSIAAAAAVLGVSQQALSARMRTLERAMSITLLARTPAGSHLTEHVLIGHEAVIEPDLERGGLAHRRHVRANPQPGRLLVHDERADAL